MRHVLYVLPLSLFNATMLSVATTFALSVGRESSLKGTLVHSVCSQLHLKSLEIGKTEGFFPLYPWFSGFNFSNRFILTFS